MASSLEEILDIVYLTMVSVLTLVCLIGNSFTCFIFTTKSFRRVSMFFYLSIGTVVNILLMLTVWPISALKDLFKIHSNLFSCKFFAYLHFFLSEIISWTDDECHDIIEIVEDEIINKQDESLIIQTKSEFVLQYSKNVLRSAFDTYEELNLPGRILYIYDLETRTSRCYPLCKGKQSFDFRWASSDEFKKIIITRRMLIDHFPNTLNDALKYFNREEII